MAVIAQALGHKDERITRRHYAHLSPSHVADTVRLHAAGMGIVERGNMVALAGHEETAPGLPDISKHDWIHRLLHSENWLKLPAIHAC